MKYRKGFTLIELLVVIAIIALLLAILIPSLKATKQQAGSATCLANQEYVIKAWLLYSNDNKEELCNGWPDRVTINNVTTVGFVNGPRDALDNPVPTNNCTVVEEIRGIKKVLCTRIMRLKN